VSAALPALATPRLRLRPVTRDDVEVLWALWTQPDVRRYLWDDRVIERAEAASTVDACLALAGDGLGLWTIEAREPAAALVGVAAGCAGLLPVSTAAQYEPRLAGLVEPLVALAPAVWRRGYAHDALTALLAYARGPLRLPRLAAVTDVPNVASDRMLRRTGFVPLSEVDGPRHRLRTYTWDAPTPPGPREREAGAPRSTDHQ
jgi:ribosomal-protein-alanine N-acetyltransferase